MFTYTFHAALIHYCRSLGVNPDIIPYLAAPPRSRQAAIRMMEDFNLRFNLTADNMLELTPDGDLYPVEGIKFAEDYSLALVKQGKPAEAAEALGIDVRIIKSYRKRRAVNFSGWMVPVIIIDKEV